MSGFYGVLQNGADLLEHDPQLKHRHFFSKLVHLEIGEYRCPGRAAFILSKAPSEVKRAPLLGEDDEYVLKNILGISDEEFAKLIKEGHMN